MVLQRDKPILVWGWADAGEQVTVRCRRQASAKAGADRAWKVTLPAAQANGDPQQLTVKGASKTLILDNILIGDVWVLGGQSNMEFELAKVENGPLEIVSANFPEIRILTVPYGQGPNLPGFARLHEWSMVRSTLPQGRLGRVHARDRRELSAIGYVFARRIHMATNVPIGIIDASRGGTTVETWTPLDVLREDEQHTNAGQARQIRSGGRRLGRSGGPGTTDRKHRQWVERQTKEGKPIPEDRKRNPATFGPVRSAITTSRATATPA